MKNIFFVSLCIVVLSACSTSDKKDSVSSVDESDQKIDSFTSNSKSTSSSVINKTSGKPIESSEKNYEALYSDLKAALVTKDDLLVERSTVGILESDANNIKALNALAMHHAGKKRYSLAEFILNRVKKNEGNSYVIYNNLGVLNFQQGKKREGIGYFKQALMVKPNYGIAAANLGAYFAEVKDYGKARSSLEIAYKAGIKDISILNNYAISLMATGSSAGEVFEEAMEIGSKNVNFLVNYCIFLVEVKKDLSKAKTILEKLKFIGPDENRKEVVMNLEKKINETQNK